MQWGCRVRRARAFGKGEAKGRVNPRIGGAAPTRRRRHPPDARPRTRPPRYLSSASRTSGAGRTLLMAVERSLALEPADLDDDVVDAGLRDAILPVFALGIE